MDIDASVSDTVDDGLLFTRNSDVLYYYPGLRPPLLKQKGNGAVAGFFVGKRLATAYSHLPHRFIVLHRLIVSSFFIVSSSSSVPGLTAFTLG